jgi:hypothetical protein
MKFLQSIKKPIRQDKISNQDIMQDLKVELLKEKLWKVRMQWYEYVICMEKIMFSLIALKIFFFFILSSTGNRPGGLLWY